MRVIRRKPKTGTSGCNMFQRAEKVLDQHAATNSDNAETADGPAS
jgi:hypothetical protein